ncbi:MAG: NAD(P)H-hydrate dehydratase [Pseudomonadota bacterium]
MDAVPDAKLVRYGLDDLRSVLPPRRMDAHKGDFGHVLVIGGNHGMYGAARLAAEGAARMGAGLVSVATRSPLAPMLAATRPELMVHTVEQADALLDLLPRASVLALGCGLGRDDWAEAMFAVAMNSSVPKVVDADALRLLPTRAEKLTDQAILTPHCGEAAHLLGTSREAVQHDRLAAVLALRARFGGLWLLKGAGSLLACTEGVYQCAHGHPGMASGGMGDVLGGMLAALLAQGMPPCAAARLAVALHGAAGERAARAEGGRGVLALDLLPHARLLLEEVCPC